QQGYPNSIEIAEDTGVVHRAMLSYKPQRMLDARKVLRPAPPGPDPNAVDVPDRGIANCILSTTRGRIRGGLWRSLCILNPTLDTESIRRCTFGPLTGATRNRSGCFKVR